MTTTTTQSVDRTDLEAKVKEVYRQVAQKPFSEFHFAMGRSLAEQLGYSPADLDRIPHQAVDSFAGVGFHFDLAAIAPEESVLDLGSGSGMDSFIAAVKTGGKGRVHGLDMTDAQREKSESLCVAAGFAQVTYHKGYIEQIPFPDGSFDYFVVRGVHHDPASLSFLDSTGYQHLRCCRSAVPNRTEIGSGSGSTRPETSGHQHADEDLWRRARGAKPQRRDHPARVAP